MMPFHHSNRNCELILARVYICRFMNPDRWIGPKIPVHISNDFKNISISNYKS
jgi:hypothetical protein